MGGVLAAILALLEDVPAGVTIAEEAIADAKALVATPAGQEIEAAFGKIFTVTTTPGSAAVVEPIATR